ncbi:MAG: helix-turn-helix domain-containing protein [Methanophagales archaeon]|nr:helix-turn-helix domain-containing protein [Methanophagales archaeon]
MAMKKELELSEKIERRLEMIHAHTKLGNTIRKVIEEFGVCRDTYYHWYHQYVEKGIFGLFDSKRDDVQKKTMEKKRTVIQANRKKVLKE